MSIISTHDITLYGSTPTTAVAAVLVGWQRIPVYKASMLSRKGFPLFVHPKTTNNPSPLARAKRSLPSAAAVCGSPWR